MALFEISGGLATLIFFHDMENLCCADYISRNTTAVKQLVPPINHKNNYNLISHHLKQNKLFASVNLLMILW